MKLGIMQPYFFPYLGYFSLIKHCDRFILLDTVQFMRHGWIERNRVLKPADGWQYVAVPVDKESMRSSIKDVRVRKDPDWKDRILRQLEHYKKKAPFYGAVTDLLADALDPKETGITRVNQRTLTATCAYLGVERDIQIFSEMGVSIEAPQGPGDWALAISRAVGATAYVNPPGGVEIFDQAQYKAAGVPILFLKNRLRPYDQRRGAFEAGLSIIDVLMFNDPKAANELIDDYVTSPTGQFP